MMAATLKEEPAPIENKNYKGFVAGVFSGIAKLSGQSFFYIRIRTPWGAPKPLANKRNPFQLATPLTLSKSGSKPQTPPASLGPYNASSRPSGMKASTGCTKAPRRPS